MSPAWTGRAGTTSSPVRADDAPHPGRGCPPPPCRQAGRRRPHVALDEAFVPAPERAADLLALDDALERLAALAPRKVRVVELRYFSGLTWRRLRECSGVGGDGMRDWRMAKLWLQRDLAACSGAPGRRSMTPERFEEVERVCHAALDQPPAAREAFLDDACRGDADLRAEVESLLAAASGAESLLEPPSSSRGRRSLPGSASGRTRSRRPSARAGWARSGRRGTRGWSATSPR